MKPDQVDTHIRRRPSVHQICLGAFLQHALFVRSDVLAVPLSPMGFNDVAHLVGDYVAADLKCEIMQKHVAELGERGKEAYPATTFVWHAASDAPAKILEASAIPSFNQARQILSWVTGEEVTPVAYVILHTVGVEFNVIPPRSRKRQRLWFSEGEADQFEHRVVRLSLAAEADSNLGLALEMFHDATREHNDSFRIVRLFNVLECLATKHKQSGLDSRDAIRAMLGIKPGLNCEIAYMEKKVSFDLISVAGKLRDKILHGAPVRDDAFAKPDRGAFPIVVNQPHLIAFELQWRLEAEIARRVS